MVSLFSPRNVQAIKKDETEKTGKDPFRIDEFAELVRVGFTGNPEVRDANTTVVQVTTEEFIKIHSFVRVTKAVDALNEQKRAGSGPAAGAAPAAGAKDAAAKPAAGKK